MRPQDCWQSFVHDRLENKNKNLDECFQRKKQSRKTERKPKDSHEYFSSSPTSLTDTEQGERPQVFLQARLLTNQTKGHFILFSGL